MFQLRKELLVQSAPADQGSAEPAQGSQSEVLTENDKYKVTQHRYSDLELPPGAIGTVDTALQRALVQVPEVLYIWDYTSLQGTPQRSRIKLPEFAEGETPLCLLTGGDAANAGGSNGIVIVYRSSGKVIFYENVDAVNNLYSKLSTELLSHQLDLKLDASRGECVTRALAMDPVGCVLATSEGRVLFVSLRDSVGRPNVRVVKQLNKPRHTRFNFGFRGTASPRDTVVSLRRGPQTNKDENTCYITTARGQFHIWRLVGAFNAYQLLNVNIYNAVLESLRDLYPFAYNSLQILDSHPVDTSGDPTRHIFLSSISDGQQKNYYILSTVIFDLELKTFSVFSTYRLNTYQAPLAGPTLPQLMIPEREPSQEIINVVVQFPHNVVLTQISSKFDLSFTLKRKWEDILSFRDDVYFIGTGYNTSQLFLMSICGDSQCKIVQVDLKGTNETEHGRNRFVKSHVEQAVYFQSTAQSTPIEFNLSDDIYLDEQIVSEDLSICSDDIFHSKSKFILSSGEVNLLGNLKSRLMYYNNFLNFVAHNFKERTSPQLKCTFIEKYEIMNCCLSLLQFIDQKPNGALQEIWSKILLANNLSLEEFVISKLELFPTVLTHLLKELAGVSDHHTNELPLIIDFLIGILYNSVLESGENQLKLNAFGLSAHDHTPLPWFITLDNLTSINDLFFQYKFELAESHQLEGKDQVSEQFLTLLKILYYCFNSVKVWFAENTAEIQAQAQQYETASQINKLYVDNHTDWNKVLCEVGYEQQSIQIAEFYQDLESLVETLETLPHDDPMSADYYDKFFEKYGYKFATALYEYYCRTNKLNDLFYRFPKWKPLLVQFLGNNQDKYGEISWIQNVFDGEYEAASKTLSGLPLLGTPMDAGQLHLNIAKLTALAADGPDVEELTRIQANLDLLAAERDLMHNIADADFTINTWYANTDFEVIYVKVLQALRETKCVSLNEVIELYTLTSSQEAFIESIRVFAAHMNTLPYDVKKYLTAAIWRRCILHDGYFNGSVDDPSKSLLYGVLVCFFEEQLYEEGDFSLPQPTQLMDHSVSHADLLTNLYAQYLNDGDVAGLRRTIDDDIEQIKNLGESLTLKVQSLVSNANDSTGNRCVVDYETNEIVQAV
ncbi:Nup133p KNAG_0C06480 [Huiozyma naganishii CBS 8797]|uniref:Nucleoporin Nup133/Nup155-like N-terminal domain-containing protein n=1 Tax=Huiozyma naganishii (strain ATCC MYA-139 / BCRC 22969 / CBS 8797 / KCTC 17520 / NBRC 10181 / NCYC 3082 / Yp74L-3) TaxID=1071383 RepID=J7S6G2_HUIN7|nr:hypothetical protein KNAG_0C06480 [Kazachstania naganishii CBS 8797]CCK69741.1 hypothetical protein KNAG_0C06480 [Kazachstania naganishii CBS 8797]